jgi:hypothetical protein
MPDFEVTSPDGKKFIVTAPEGAKQDEVLSYAKQQFAAQSKPAARDPDSSSMLGTYARGVVQSATAGLADEARAWIDEKLGRGDYDANLAANREQLKADAELHPVAGFAGNVAGGVGGAVLAAPVVAAAGVPALAGRVLAPVAARLNPLLSRLPTWAGTAAKVSGGGAAGGGAAGFGEGEGGFANRAENALQGAALGATVAPVIGGAVHAASGLASRVTHGLGLRNPDVAAERQIVRAMDRSGVSLDDAEARLAAGGNAPLALVDVGGRNTVQLGAVAANTPGAAMEAADVFAQGRRITRPDRLMEAGDQAFGGGSGPGVAARNAALDAQRRAQAGPLYDAVRAHGAVDDAGVNDVLLSLPDDVFTKASTFARLAGREPERLIAVGDNGREIARVPTTTDLDHVVRALGDKIETAKRAGDNTLARELTIAKGKLTGQLDDIIVDPNTGQRLYADARAAYAGPSAQLDAIEEGRTAFRTDRDVVAERMATAPADVQDAYRLGAGRDFADRVSDPSTAANQARVILENHQNQARLNSLLAPDVRDALNTTLRREVDMKAVENAVSPRAGSQTGRLGAGAEDMANDPIAGAALGVLDATSRGGWTAAAAHALRSAAKRGQGINPATSDALANRLFTVDPVQRAVIITQLRNRLMQDGASAAEAQRIMRPVLRGLGTAAGMQAE